MEPFAPGFGVWIVNDKGCYRQQPESGAYRPLQALPLATESQGGRSPHLELLLAADIPFRSSDNACSFGPPPQFYSQDVAADMAPRLVI